MQLAIIFPTCVVDAVKPEVGVATARVLWTIGTTVHVPPRRLAWSTGMERSHAKVAAKVARTTLAALFGKGVGVIEGNHIVRAGDDLLAPLPFGEEITAR